MQLLTSGLNHVTEKERGHVRVRPCSNTCMYVVSYTYRNTVQLVYLVLHIRERMKQTVYINNTVHRCNPYNNTVNIRCTCIRILYNKQVHSLMAIFYRLFFQGNNPSDYRLSGRLPKNCRCGYQYQR